ncbi:hypothetical protein H5410_020887 [Solanum commersonii]|uniref:Uncharacterized protein n=1 Tax=Solanum commersonii TaxID=4109 RepID=A0A9J5ZFK0_SOLCO|nr:hypothetical protein H5410_020887 [Solanum commersonii]
MELGWMVAIDFFTNFVWFLKIKVWGSFILDYSFFQGAQSKGFQDEDDEDSHGKRGFGDGDMS